MDAVNWWVVGGIFVSGIIVGHLLVRVTFWALERSDRG